MEAPTEARLLLVPVTSEAEVRVYNLADDLGLTATRLVDNIWVFRGTAEAHDALARSIEGITTDYLFAAYEYVGSNADSSRTIVEPNSGRNVDLCLPYLLILDTLSDDLTKTIECLKSRGVDLHPLMSRTWICAVPAGFDQRMGATYADHVKGRVWDCSADGTDYVIVRIAGAATGRRDWYDILRAPGMNVTGSAATR